ncbi:MAG: hypothetical protein WC223_11285, partial [Bacteroidales bacterium]
EAKSKDIITIDFIGKFILLSNNEDNFIQMDKEDKRFFVVKVPILKEKDPHFLKNKLAPEIPAFLNFIANREITYPDKSRLWFASEVFETEALRKVVVSSRSKIEKELINWFDEMFCYEAIENEIKCIPKLLYNEIKERIRGFNFAPVDIEKIMKENWKLIPEQNQRFNFPRIVERYNEGQKVMVTDIDFFNTVGRCFTIKKELIESLQNF